MDRRTTLNNNNLLSLHTRCACNTRTLYERKNNPEGRSLMQEFPFLSSLFTLISLGGKKKQGEEKYHNKQLALPNLHFLQSDTYTQCCLVKWRMRQRQITASSLLHMTAALCCSKLSAVSGSGRLWYRASLAPQDCVVKAVNNTT